MPRHIPDFHKPGFAPSYTLHVVPSQFAGTGNFGGMDFWSLQGFDLKRVIELLYDINPIRVDLPASIDDGRHYDFSLVLPQPEDKERMRERFRLGIQEHFHLTATRENRGI